MSQLIVHRMLLRVALDLGDEVVALKGNSEAKIEISRKESMDLGNGHGN